MKHIKAKFRKAVRNMNYKAMVGAIQEYNMELAKLYGDPSKLEGGLMERSQEIKMTKWRLAVLKTIAKERGMRIE